MATATDTDSDSPHPGLTAEMLLRDLLNNCSMQRGQTWIIHASLKSIGQVQGGAVTVVQALEEAVGPQGTLLMPAFANPQPDGIFDIARTPSRTGLISETFRHCPGVLRSRHPTHAVAAWGARAAEFVADHHHTSGLGVGSPFHKAAQADAQVLMIGCALDRLSVIHVAEAMVRVPYLGKVCYPGYERTLHLIDLDGQSHRCPPRDPPGDSANFIRVQDVLAQRGLLHRVRLGAAACLRLTADDAVAAAVELLLADPAALLCDHPRCPVCPQARRWLQSNRPGAPGMLEPGPP